ncbi:MAG: hypothetical protein A2664_02515 [Candidatus Taylorbacteria bacterium RIFCSPHIGHO2_01_FULL_46_22b]|uniref:Uncharacterized protein n=1 Tax=Candidatus Taylorbacteria bacterium RIFCSPHIGHO2_01_FULL_46_22b TaxID=1802301 RepID=A0A1G2M5G6_9BACT|nr:MAG: hypothetical protein A2664_02515 [Candidatus Taylorbacteria bacterium RIFCSPHIGHO2_01_FULL_46_22b]
MTLKKSENLVARKPASYPTGRLGCGMHVATAIADGFDKGKVNDARSLPERVSGFTRPEVLAGMLYALGFPAKIRRLGKFPDEVLIGVVTRQIRNATPIVLLVGAGPWNRARSLATEP